MKVESVSLKCPDCAASLNLTRKIKDECDGIVEAFINQKGYATIVECEHCGNDVALNLLKKESGTSDWTDKAYEVAELASDIQYHNIMNVGSGAVAIGNNAKAVGSRGVFVAGDFSGTIIT